jgi:hypothetical protein
MIMKNERLYKVSLDVLTSNGVEADLAAKASKVVANDDPTKPNLGRSAKDQQVVNEAMSQYHAHQKRET